ncbi:MAG: hypothetical protein ABIG95_06585 [Candidatus Woesearchaeota archaeon]
MIVDNSVFDRYRLLNGFLLLRECNMASGDFLSMAQILEDHSKGLREFRVVGEDMQSTQWLEAEIRAIREACRAKSDIYYVLAFDEKGLYKVLRKGGEGLEETLRSSAIGEEPAEIAERWLQPWPQWEWQAFFSDTILSIRVYFHEPATGLHTYLWQSRGQGRLFELPQPAFERMMEQTVYGISLLRSMVFEEMVGLLKEEGYRWDIGPMDLAAALGEVPCDEAQNTLVMRLGSVMRLWDTTSAVRGVKLGGGREEPLQNVLNALVQQPVDTGYLGSLPHFFEQNLSYR